VRFCRLRDGVLPGDRHGRPCGIPKFLHLTGRPSTPDPAPSTKTLCAKMSTRRSSAPPSGRLTSTSSTPAVWAQGSDGTGEGVAVIDSGISPVPDLNAAKSPENRVVYSQSLITAPAAANDQCGHGNRVAGLLAGNGAQSTCGICISTFRGTAPNANLIDLRVLDITGTGTDSGVIQAIEAAISLQMTYNTRVINLSLGRPNSRELHSRPAGPRGGACIESRHRDGGAGRQSGAQSVSECRAYGIIEAPGNRPM
jgi:serine protease AprX